jgi:DNA-binding SARP family transcriptional activator
MEYGNNILYISLFGDLEIRQGKTVLPKFTTQKAISLFSKLVLNPGKYFSRDSLADTFWGNLPIDKAKKCLRTDLWRIRKIVDSVRDDDQSYFIIKKGHIGFDGAADYWLDVREFEEKLDFLSHLSIDDIDDEGYQTLQICVDLYKGDLLETLHDDWCCLQRVALRSQFLTALEILMRYHKHRSEWGLAISCGQQLLGHDPLLEHIHLELIRCHYLKGNRPAAIKQYIECRRLLRDELGVSPMDETERVYRTILSVKKPMQVDNNSVSKVPANIGQDKSVVKKVDMALANIFNAEGLLTIASKQLHQDDK